MPCLAYPCDAPPAPAFVQLGAPQDLARREKGLGDFGFEMLLPVIGSLVTIGGQIGVAEYQASLQRQAESRARKQAELLAARQALEEARRQAEYLAAQRAQAEYLAAQQAQIASLTPMSAGTTATASYGLGLGALAILAGGGLLAILGLRGRR